MTQRFALALVFLTCAAPGCGTDYALRTRLYATAWTQTSGEYASAALQAYAAATGKLDEALADPSWTACLEQEGDYAELPPAVIVDIDETIFDNTPFHAMLDEKELEFNDELWADWVEEADAKAVPGARIFLREARARGIAIFYVTNRTHDLEKDTRENFRELEIPVPAEPDRVLTRDERPDWGRDKISRRRFVAGTHRVLMIVGDDLGDFAPVTGLSAKERRRVAFEYRERWGRTWFVVPNPIYGGWERVIEPIRMPFSGRGDAPTE